MYVIGFTCFCVIGASVMKEFNAAIILIQWENIVLTNTKKFHSISLPHSSKCVWLDNNSQFYAYQIKDSLFHDEGSYHIETSPMNCSGNQWTRFHIIGTSVKKELKVKF